MEPDLTIGEMAAVEHDRRIIQSLANDGVIPRQAIENKSVVLVVPICSCADLLPGVEMIVDHACKEHGIQSHCSNCNASGKCVRVDIQA